MDENRTTAELVWALVAVMETLNPQIDREVAFDLLHEAIVDEDEPFDDEKGQRIGQMIILESMPEATHAN